MTELYIFNCKRLIVQYLAIRRIRRVIAVFGALLLICVIIYSQLQNRKNIVSAVGCKSKIAQVGLALYCRISKSLNNIYRIS